MLPEAIEHFINYKNHVTNEDGEYDELLTLVKQRQLRWFGHVSRSAGLA